MEKAIKYVFTLLFLSVQFIETFANVAPEENVPVMLWSEKSIVGLKNPLQKILKPQFQQFLKEHLSKKHLPVIVFVFKDNLCIEDIKQRRESLQKLNYLGSLSYLTSVEAPISVFETLPSYNITTDGSELFSPDKITEGTLVFFMVTDLDIIFDVYNSMKSLNRSLLVAITGKTCRFQSSERNKRSVHSSQITNFLIKNKAVLFYADDAPLLKIGTDTISLELKDFDVKTDRNNYNLTMNFTGGKSFEITLKAKFDIKNGYFSLAGFEYLPNEDNSKQIFLKTKNDIIFPHNFSYHCQHENIFYDKDTEIVLQLTNFQVQMDTDRFDAAYDCVGFTSISIWTGLFVTTILAIIIGWGLVMIIDIRTMDHFDDPKGKTISIAAQD